MANIKVIHNEAKRGCGYRKPGGMYLVSEGLSLPCGKLPIPLDVCPTCGNGIKHSRGWTWIQPRALLENLACSNSYCGACPMTNVPERVGLLWIGESFYKTTSEFELEASLQGVSRRISAVPREFKVSETWVWLAHIKAITQPCAACAKTSEPDCEECGGKRIVQVPGVFQAFRPQRIEYILKGDETVEELDSMEARGITLVDLRRDSVEQPSEQADLFAEIVAGIH